MPYYKVKKTSLVAVADAIRSTAGTEDALSFPDGFINAVEGIEAGGSGGGGAIEHTYTVDYTPSVNTRAFTLPIHGFAYAPAHVCCYALDELPTITGLQGCIKLSVFEPMSTDPRTQMTYGNGKVIAKKPDIIPALDFWNCFTKITATNTELIIDATDQNNWEFIGGITYRFIMVEDI